MPHNEVIEISSVKAKKNEKKIWSMVFPNSKSKREEKAKKDLPGIQPGAFGVHSSFRKASRMWWAAANSSLEVSVMPSSSA